MAEEKKASTTRKKKTSAKAKSSTKTTTKKKKSTALPKVKGKANLVIVESPAKAKTIEKYLGKDFVVKASNGHVRDLPGYTMGVDIENEFQPKYQVIKGKATLLKELKAYVGQAETVWLATDPDREGEAIAWHVKEGADIPDDKTKRIVFNEITKTAVQAAIENARQIDQDLVDAQQARRVFDRIIGYRMSPVLSRKIRKGLSAGRVQSVALKFICERGREIQAFVPEEYWVITAELDTENQDNVTVQLFAKGDAKSAISIASESEAKQIEAELKSGSYAVKSVQQKDAQRHPSAPFITSTLQQDASRKLGWSAKKTMMVAQRLYEGVDVRGESTGLITYMRTDSTRLSDEAKAASKSFIQTEYGSEYLPEKPRVYKSKGGAQDAHEAIRPTNASFTPSAIRQFLPKEQEQLYTLIWQRFMASQMASAKVKQTTVIVENSEYLFKVTGQITLFDGFRRVYEEGKEEYQASDSDRELPALIEGQSLNEKELELEQKFTQPPHRFSEASLVKVMEEKGIGRPSTYAPTISTLLDRQYIDREKRQLIPTELGMIVDEKLCEFFPKVVDVDFTAQMETELDEVVEGKHKWHNLLGEFYPGFMEQVDYAAENMEKMNMDKPSDEICEKCSSPMVIKVGRYGEFLACTNYPDCKTTKAIVQELDVNCPDCSSAIVERKTRRGKVFYGCSGYPKCTYATWKKPVAKTCPDCATPILVEKSQKADDEAVLICEKEGCGYESA